MRDLIRPWATLGMLCLAFGTAVQGKTPAALSVPALAAPETPVSEATPATSRAASRKPDPMLSCFLGVIPLASGYYLTSTPMKGLIFSVGDAVLIGSIYNIRRDDYIPDGDVVPYFYLIGAVNAIDATLSYLQARRDLGAFQNARVQASLNLSGNPVIGMAWTF